MKKYVRISAFILAAVFLFSSCTLIGYALDQDIAVEDFIFANNSDNTLTLKKYKGSGGVVYVPETVNGKNVTVIGNDAFGEDYDSTPDQNRITTVILPISVKVIERKAFLECTKLSEISMTGVETIGEGAFWDCKSLEKVAVSSALRTIEDNAFAGKCGKFKMYCEDGSYAQAYAKSNSIAYSALYPEKITFSKKSTSVSKGKKITLSVKITPSDAYYRGVRMYTSGNKLTVTDGGTVKGLKIGKQKVYCAALVGKVKTYCTVEVKLPPVSNIKAVKKTYSSLKLSWDKVKDADGYRLEMKVNGKWKKLAQTKKTNYVLTGLSPQTKYSFRIRSYTVKGDSKKNSEWVVFSKSTRKVSKVKNITATSDSNSRISFSWSKASNAEGYIIYAMDSKGKYKKIAQTKKLTFTQSVISGTKKQYKVRAYATYKKKRIYGNYSNVFVFSSNPAPISELKVSSKTQNSISLKWKGARNVDGYSMYIVENGKYKFVGNSKSASYTFTSLSSDTTYKFAVRSYINTPQKTVYSGYKTISADTESKYTIEHRVASDINSVFSKISSFKDLYVVYQEKISLSIESCDGNTSDADIVAAYVNMFCTNQKETYDFKSGKDEAGNTPYDIFIPESGFSINESDIIKASKVKDGSGFDTAATIKAEAVSEDKVPTANSHIWGRIDKNVVSETIKDDASLMYFNVKYTGTAMSMKVNAKGTFDNLSLNIPFEVDMACNIGGRIVKTKISGKITRNYILTWW